MPVDKDPNRNIINQSRTPKKHFGAVDVHASSEITL
jgi:hypothetical protein